MKKLAITAGVAFVLLTGCTREIVIREVAAPTVPTTSTTTTTTPPTTIPAMTDRELFLEFVRDNTTLYAMSDYELVEFGNLVCDLFDAGGTIDDLAATIADAVLFGGLSEDDGYDFATVAGAAVTYFCPQYQYLV